jgi:hypothetical protein
VLRAAVNTAVWRISNRSLYTGFVRFCNISDTELEKFPQENGSQIT